LGYWCCYLCLPEEVLHYSFGFHGCLGTSNGSSMGESNKCLEYNFILGSFCGIFKENYEPHVIIYTPILVLRLSMVLFYILQVSDLFALALTPIEYVLTPHRCPQVTMPMEKKKEPENFETEATTDTPCWRSGCVVSLKLLAFLSSFILWLRTPKFMLKKGFFSLQKNESQDIYYLSLSHFYH